MSQKNDVKLLITITESLDAEISDFQKAHKEVKSKHISKSDVISLMIENGGRDWLLKTFEQFNRVIELKNSEL